MDITKQVVINNVGSFVAVLLFFGAAWKYLDEQRVEVFKVREEAIKLKADADARTLYLQKKDDEATARAVQLQAEIAAKDVQLKRLEAQLGQNETGRGIDEELKRLSSKYLEESSSVDITKTCVDDERQNEKVRKAKATLTLIENLAKKHNKAEFISFARQQRGGVYSWGEKCKP